MSAPKHEFALYLATLSSLLLIKKQGDHLILHDEVVFRRVVHILRLRNGEVITLFDNHIHAQVQLLNSVGKKSVEFIILSIAANNQLIPTITVLLPVLKREALEEAVYACVELGANTIQLITTDKVQRAFGGEKEYQRIGQIMIAAAEQSKQFSMPTLLKTIALSEALEQSSSIICCDLEGDYLLPILEQMRKDTLDNYVILIGPEGDFTPQERELLIKKNVIRCALTPTVLRAQQALIVILGALRSVLRI